MDSPLELTRATSGGASELLSESCGTEVISQASEPAGSELLEGTCKRNGKKPAAFLRGVSHSLFSEAGIARPASCHSYCILTYSQTSSLPLFSTTEQRTVPEYSVLLPIISENKSLSHTTHKISSPFIPIIFAEGHIVNSPFVAIVPYYALLVRRTVMGSRYRFTDLTRLKQLSTCIIIHMSLNVLSHITA